MAAMARPRGGGSVYPATARPIGDGRSWGAGSVYPAQMAAAPAPPGGFIFGCTDETQAECFSRRLFGQPGGPNAEEVAAIRPGTPLFLFNFRTRVRQPRKTLSSKPWT
jgi:Development and cell death domain